MEGLQAHAHAAGFAYSERVATRPLSRRHESSPGTKELRPVVEDRLPSSAMGKIILPMEERYAPRAMANRAGRT